MPKKKKFLVTTKHAVIQTIQYEVETTCSEAAAAMVLAGECDGEVIDTQPPLTPSALERCFFETVESCKEVK